MRGAGTQARTNDPIGSSAIMPIWVTAVVCQRQPKKRRVRCWLEKNIYKDNQTRVAPQPIKWKVGSHTKNTFLDSPDLPWMSIPYLVNFQGDLPFIPVDYVRKRERTTTRSQGFSTASRRIFRKNKKKDCQKPKYCFCTSLRRGKSLDCDAAAPSCLLSSFGYRHGIWTKYQARQNKIKIKTR